MGEIWGRNGRETAVAEWRWGQRHGATFDGYQDPLLPPRDHFYRCGCTVLLHKMRPPTKDRLADQPDDSPACLVCDDDGGPDVPAERQSVDEMLHAERARRGLVGGRILGLCAQWCSCSEGRDHAYKPTADPEQLHGAVASDDADAAPGQNAVASVKWLGAQKGGRGKGGGAGGDRQRPRSAGAMGAAGYSGGGATPFQRWGYRTGQ